jgi:hypothetical protein
VVKGLVVAPGADRRDAADELDTPQRRADPRREHQGLGLPGQLTGQCAVASHARAHRPPDHLRGLPQGRAGEHDRAPRLLSQQPRQRREPAFPLGVERSQHQDGHVRLDQHVLESVTDRGQQRDRHRGYPARHEPEHPEGGVVHPVQVVGDDEQSAAGCGAG